MCNVDEANLQRCSFCDASFVPMVLRSVCRSCGVRSAPKSIAWLAEEVDLADALVIANGSFMLHGASTLHIVLSCRGSWRYLPLGLCQFFYTAGTGMCYPTAFAFINRRSFATYAFSNLPVTALRLRASAAQKLETPAVNTRART